MRKIIYIIVVICLMLNISCQKVIDIDLNNSTSQIVIEGNIYNTNENYIVKVTKSINFSDSNSFPYITNAFITISDQTGLKDTLTYLSKGKYTTSKIKGIPGYTYTIIAQINNQIYTAQSQMPEYVNLDSVKLELVSSLREGKILSPVAYFKDPINTTNYYRLTRYLNNKIIGTYVLQNDQYKNGQTISRTIRTTMTNGDTLKVKLLCIDKYVYNFYSTLYQNTNGNFSTSTPTNPVSNFTGGCLGYFSAQTVSSNTQIVKSP